MSAPLGGASFDLGVRRDRYRQELNEAINEARQAAQQIQAALSGGQSLPQLQAGEQNRALVQLATTGEAASAEIKQLATNTEAAIRPAQQMAAAYTAAANAARDLAAAQQGASSNANIIRKAVATDPAFFANQTQITPPPGRPNTNPAFAPPRADTGTTPFDDQTTQGFRALAVSAAQVQANMSGASVAVQHVGQAANGTVNEIKALVGAQSALNSLVSAFAKAEIITAGAEDIAEAVSKAQDALASVNAGDYSKAFTQLGDASIEARAALHQVNAEIANLITGNVDLGKLQKLIDEFEDLRAAGVSPDHPILRDLKDQIDAAGGSTDGSGNEEEQTLVRLNAQAKTLTQSIAQLSSAQKALAVDSGSATESAAKLTAEQKRQNKELEESVERTRLMERARDSALFAQSDPRILAREDAIPALRGAGLSQKEAKDSVERLQASILAIDKLKISGNVAEGLGQIDRAAELADKAMDAFANGDRVRGIELERQALGHLKQAMTELGVSAAKIRGDMIGILTPDKNQEIAPVLAQASRVSAAIKSTEAALRSSRAPEIAAEVKAEQDIAKAKKDGAEATDRQARGSRQIRSQLYSSAQDLGYAVGAGQAGQLTAGIGRLSEVLVSTGIVTSTAAAAALTAGIVALGAAVGLVVIKGFEFNAFLEESKVRLEATEGSAAKAQIALDHLVGQAGSRTFGSFDFKDLENAEALLKRLGQDRDGDLTRIADLAAVAGKSMTDTATQVAHLYDTIKGGGPIGDMVRSLERSGLLTAQWGNRLLAAAASGATVEEQIALLDEAFSRFDGTAAKMGTTTTSSLNRVKVAFGALAGSFTEDAFKIFGEGLAQAADVMSSPKTKEGVRLYKELAGHLADITITVGTLGANKALAPFFTEKTSTSKQLVETQDIDIPQRYNSAKSAIESGRRAVNDYATGFNDASRAAFADISRTVEDNLKAISGGKLASVTEIAIAGTINPLLAELTREIQDTGTISEQTAERVRAALGGEAQRVLELATAYANLRNAKQEVDRAGNELNTARGNLQITGTFRTSVLGQDQQIIDNARKAAQEHQDRDREKIDDLNDVIANAQKVADGVDKVWAAREKAIAGQIKALDEANRAEAESARVAIQRQQDSLASYQEGIAARRKGAARDIAGLQDVVSEIDQRLSAASSAQTQHQDAFNAAINGTIDLFNVVNKQQDDITRGILAKWDAEISGHRRARQEAEQAVDKNEIGSLELRLKYDQRIQDARKAGRIAEASALERDRDRVLATRQRDSQVDRDKAELERRKEQAAIGDATKTQAQVGAQDQAGVNTIEGEKTVAQQAVEAAQKREQVLQESEDAEVDRRQKEIAHLQRVEEDRARIAAATIAAKQQELEGIQEGREADKAYFDDYIAFNRGKIEEIQKAGREQKKIDDAAILAAQAQYDKDKIYWDGRYAADQQALADAQGVYDNAVVLAGIYTDQITSLGTINKALDDRLIKEQAILEILKQQYGLTKDPPPLSGLGPSGRGEGATGEGAGSHPYEGPVAAPKPLLEGRAGQAAPPGYHTELDNAGQFWYVPDGYRLENFGKQSANSGAGAAGAAALSGAAAALARPSFAFAQGGIIAEHVIGIGQTSGSRYEFGERGIRERVSPVIPGATDNRSGAIIGPLFTIGTVNASDPVDVDRMIATATARVFGIGIGALDVTKRGGVVRGRAQ